MENARVWATLVSAWLCVRVMLCVTAIVDPGSAVCSGAATVSLRFVRLRCCVSLRAPGAACARHDVCRCDCGRMGAGDAACPWDRVSV